MSTFQQKRVLSGWEHWQVDLQIDLQSEGVTTIHSIERLGVTLLGQIEGGVLVGLTMVGQTEEEITSLTPPLDTRSAAGVDPSSLSGSWQVSGGDITIHTDLWIEENGAGFADIFACGER